MKKQSTLTIATLNTQGILAFSSEFFKKCAAVAAYFNKEPVDVVNFQEVFFHQHFRYLKKKMHAFPYCTYQPSIFGPRAGLVTFSRKPLEYCWYKDFSKVGDLWNKTLVSRLGKKGMLLSYIKDTDQFIVNTHFSANFSNDWGIVNADTQLLQLQLHELCTNVESTQGNCFVSGDFNIQKDSYIYKQLINGSLTDAFADTRRATHRGDIFVASDKNLQVDYILFNKAEASINSKTYIFDEKVVIGETRKFVSDHAGLQVTFKI